MPHCVLCKVMNIVHVWQNCLFVLKVVFNFHVTCRARYIKNYNIILAY